MDEQEIKVVHLGEPRTKSNAHFYKYNKAKRKMDVYIPDEIVEYEAELRETAIKATAAQGYTEPLAGPIRISIKYFLSTRRAKDLTNLPKTTCDALCGVCYDDDSMIVQATMVKYYDKNNPRVEIVVTPAKELKLYDWPLAERFLKENPDRAISRRKDTVNSAPKPKPRRKQTYRRKRK